MQMKTIHQSKLTVRLNKKLYNIESKLQEKKKKKEV